MAVTTEKINNFVFSLIVLDFASTKSILNAAGIHFCACLFSKVLLVFLFFFFKSASIECDFSLASLHRSTVFQKNFGFWDKMCCFLLTFMWWKRTGYLLKDCIVFMYFYFLFLNVFTLWTHVHFFRCILFIINCLSIYIIVIFHLVSLNKNKNIIKQIKMIKKDWM